MSTEAKREVTVEEALAEMREMFPDRMTLITRNDTLAFVSPKLNHWVIIFRFEQFTRTKIGEGETLDAAMAQVREWNAKQPS